MLLQLRAKDKLQYPDLWDISAAGHVTAGEEPVISCVREMEEEIGLSVSAEDLQFYRIEKYHEPKNNNEFAYIYFIKLEEDINNFKLQDEEVQMAEFVAIDKLEEDLKSDYGRFCPHGEYWFNVIAEVRKRLRNN
jgi:isopentenyldiphosphate isomerase